MLMEYSAMQGNDLSVTIASTLGILTPKTPCLLRVWGYGNRGISILFQIHHWIKVWVSGIIPPQGSYVAEIHDFGQQVYNNLTLETNKQTTSRKEKRRGNHMTVSKVLFFIKFCTTLYKSYLLLAESIKRLFIEARIGRGQQKISNQL